MIRCFLLFVKKAIIVLSVFVFFSCSSQKQLKPEPDNLQLLSRALHTNQSDSIDLLLEKVRLTENMQNLISFYRILNVESYIKLKREINYLMQFYPQMNPVHQNMLEQMIKWVYLKQIYKEEISQSVRILQRDQLYIAPSLIDFKDCENQQKRCALNLRKELAVFISDQEITSVLKKMALNDPCINLSSEPENNEPKANRCIRMMRENLVIHLLDQPEFSSGEWLQALNL